MLTCLEVIGLRTLGHFRPLHFLVVVVSVVPSVNVDTAVTFKESCLHLILVEFLGEHALNAVLALHSDLALTLLPKEIPDATFFGPSLTVANPPAASAMSFPFSLTISRVGLTVLETIFLMGFLMILL
jgi:hypothetical protein